MSAPSACRPPPIAFFSRGVFFWGTLAITLFVFSDMLDGLIARARGTSSRWGAFLDSSCDRVGDAAIFGSIAIWYAGDGHSLPLVGAAIYALAAGGVISYVKARAEALGFDCNTGFAERGERLLIVLVAAAITGLGVVWLLPAALWFLCARHHDHRRPAAALRLQAGHRGRAKA